VAVGLEGIYEALDAHPAVIAVNTASRDLTAEQAASRAARAARMLLSGGRPDIVFKKIDSRLKGNIGRETEMVARVFGYTHAVVAPAVPDQERFTIAGTVVGRGASAALAIAPFFAGQPFTADIRDAESDTDLDRVAADYRGQWDRTLAVGARGLGGALARSMGGSAAGSAPVSALASAPVNAPFTIEPAAALFAFGSTDPITLGQMEALRPWVSVIEAPEGHLPEPAAARLPLLARITGAGGDTADAVARRFAKGIARYIAVCRPSGLVMGGGDTALAILQELGARVLYPAGEAAPGLPAFDVGQLCGLRCVAKSGGFGSRDVLAGLLRAEAHGGAVNVISD